MPPRSFGEKALLEGLLASREKDRMREVTVCWAPPGTIWNSGLTENAHRIFASQGQTRALILAFKIAELRGGQSAQRYASFALAR